MHQVRSASLAVSGMQGVCCFKKSGTEGCFKANKKLKQPGSRQLEEGRLRFRVWKHSQHML